MTEIPPYRLVEGSVEPEEVAGEFSMSVERIIRSSRSQLFEIERDLEKQVSGEENTKNYLDEGTSDDVERAIENLTERTQKLFGCVGPDASQEALANFSRDLRIRTETMEKVMKDVARSKLLLSRMIYRYGLAIQIKLDGEKLLSQETRLELRELDEQLQDLFEE